MESLRLECNFMIFIPLSFTRENSLLIPSSLILKISFIHQDVGCDHKIGSGAEEDICGVCKGNGTMCRTVEGRFNQLAGSGTVTTG